MIGTGRDLRQAVEGKARTFEKAVVYGDYEQERILHEGEVLLLSNGWVELPTGRLLSPEAVHHIDVEVE